jgi:riboflavin transporter FmnP
MAAKQDFIRIDYIFSYWIFAWFILYVGGIVKASPKLGILIGIIENIGAVLIFAANGVSWATIMYFIGINLLLKGVPYYVVRRDTITQQDFAYLLAVFGIYCGWLWINHTDGIQAYRELMNGFLERPGGKKSAIRYWFESWVEKF